jgi:hypothetical protein
VSEDTLDTFLGGVATTGCVISECIKPVREDKDDDGDDGESDALYLMDPTPFVDG